MPAAVRGLAQWSRVPLLTLNISGGWWDLLSRSSSGLTGLSESQNTRPPTSDTRQGWYQHHTRNYIQNKYKAFLSLSTGHVIPTYFLDFVFSQLLGGTVKSIWLFREKYSVIIIFQTIISSYGLQLRKEKKRKLETRTKWIFLVSTFRVQ